MRYDFQGWATKYNVLCSDGRTIKPGAFKDQNGAKVPLVWGHIHDDPTAVLGYAVLEHRDEGVWCYGLFNDSEQGRNGKLLVEHGDVDSVSICANKLKQTSKKEVLHGRIRELSLVLAGANDGAHIEPILAHSDDTEASELLVYTDEFIELNHADDEIPEIPEPKEEAPEVQEEITHEEKGATEMAETKEKTVGDVLTGILLSLLAQRYTIWDAARLGVFAHGLAGDLAASALTEIAMTATDIIRFLPQAWRQLEATTNNAR